MGPKLFWLGITARPEAHFLVKFLVRVCNMGNYSRHDNWVWWAKSVPAWELLYDRLARGMTKNKMGIALHPTPARISFPHRSQGSPGCSGWRCERETRNERCYNGKPERDFSRWQGDGLRRDCGIPQEGRFLGSSACSGRIVPAGIARMLRSREPWGLPLRGVPQVLEQSPQGARVHRRVILARDCPENVLEIGYSPDMPSCQVSCCYKLGTCIPWPGG